MRHYSRFANACCWWCPASAGVLIVGLLFFASHSVAARVTAALLGVAVVFLFTVMGGYMGLVGLSLFYRRLRTSKLGALFGLCAGLLLGGFTVYLGIVGLMMILR